jgi:hypothetical protein
MPVACWIAKATNAHTACVCVILVAFPLQQWLHERAAMLLSTYIACTVHSLFFVYLSCTGYSGPERTLLVTLHVGPKINSTW